MRPSLVEVQVLSRAPELESSLLRESFNSGAVKKVPWHFRDDLKRRSLVEPFSDTASHAENQNATHFELWASPLSRTKFIRLTLGLE